MKLEEQVVSLELAKKLKELGVPQVSLWYWIRHQLNMNNDWEVHLPTAYPNNNEDDMVSAFTVAELGEMLPRVLESKSISRTFLKYYQHQDGDWICEYVDQPPYRNTHSLEYAPTEADARAKILIYLIEEGLLDVKSLKV